MENFRIELPINKIICGDSLSTLKTFESESVDCVITSPPYYGLRDYGFTEQTGLEPTYQEYITRLCDVFDEVKRVLKKEGTCFVNLGDTYNGSKSGHTDNKNKKANSTTFQKNKDRNIQPKSLMMIPERFAMEMIERGWVLRNKIPWIKPNAMPESVEDMWKKAHEYIFFFVKSQKYYFDLDAIRTKHKDVSIKRAEYEQGRNALGQNASSIGEKYSKDKSDKYGMPARQVKLNEKGAVPPDYFIVNTNCSSGDTVVEHYATYPQSLIYPLVVAGCPKSGIILDPFNGSGTTCITAIKQSRNYIGIDMSEDYCKIANERIKGQTPPLF